MLHCNSIKFFLLSLYGMGEVLVNPSEKNVCFKSRLHLIRDADSAFTKELRYVQNLLSMKFMLENISAQLLQILLLQISKLKW